MSAAMAPGSIGLGLYLHDGPAGAAVDHLVAQAVLAERSGFDAVTVAEHHAGFRSYLPNPLLAASWMLDATERVWSGPNPLLLPLRDALLVAEDLAWLAVRFPGRVAAGFAAGYHEDDFAALGNDGFAGRGRRYGEQLVALAAALDGGAAAGRLAGDHAIAQLAPGSVPLAGAAGSAAAARRAARAGVGWLMDSMATADDLARIAGEYVAAGGDGPRVLGRRVWVGAPPLHLFEAQLSAYQSKAEPGSWLQAATGDALIGGRAEEVAERVSHAAEAAGATVLALRVHLPGLTPEQACEQIEAVAAEVLPRLRADGGWSTSARARGGPSTRNHAGAPPGHARAPGNAGTEET